MIRAAQHNDIERILAILHQVAMVHHRLRPDLFRPESSKYDAADLRRILSQPDTPVFVYEEEGEVLGYVFCQIQVVANDGLLHDRSTLYIDDLCVDAKARRRHIAQSLYDFVLDYARREGFYNITLNVWEGNTAARCFYEHQGMSIQKTTMEQILRKDE